MAIPWSLTKLLYDLSEQNYDRTFSAYRHWIQLEAAYGNASNQRLYNDILSNTRPDLITVPSREQPVSQGGLFGGPAQSGFAGSWVQQTSNSSGFAFGGSTQPAFGGTPFGNVQQGLVKGQLIHSRVHLLLRFITDAERDPALSTYATGLHDRLCHESLERFFRQVLDHTENQEDTLGQPTRELSEFYTGVNLIAHWVNLGYVKLEDVRDHILQSLIGTFQTTVYPLQLNSLMILLKISGATFAAYVDPSVMDRCRDLLQPNNLGSRLVLAGLAEEVLRLQESNWQGLPPPPALRNARRDAPQLRDPAATPVVTSLGLPGVAEQSRRPASPPSPESPFYRSPRSSAPPSPSTSITALSDFTVADSLDDEVIAEPETVTRHDTFYLEDGSVEVLCGTTLFRVHTSTLSFRSPVLRRMFSPATLVAAESPNGCPRIASPDTSTDFATLLTAIYLPEFQDGSGVPGFSTFSSLLRVSTNYEMPGLRTRLIESIRGAYPSSFTGLDPSRVLGEDAFDGPKPHPNAVLNLFIQQRVTSALPMAYYMAARRGLDSLMDTRLPSSATLSGQTLGSAIRGLVALREMELKETHRIAFSIRGDANSAPCSSLDCRSMLEFSDTAVVGTYQRAFDRITGSVSDGTRILQLLSPSELAEDAESKFCQTCEEGMQKAHAEVRKRAWAALPEVFGLRA